MAFNALQALQTFGLGRQMAQQDRQQRTRADASRMAASGDYEGAAQTALGGGEYDLAGQIRALGQQQRSQALQEAQIIGTEAARLRGIADPAQRQTAWAALRPQLEGLGFFSPGELDGVDLSDTALDNYVSIGNRAMGILQPRTQQQPTSFQQDLIAAGPGYAPGTANYRRLLEQRYAPPPRIITDERGQRFIVEGGTGDQGRAPVENNPDVVHNPQTGEYLRFNAQTNAWEPVQDARPANDPAPAFHAQPGGGPSPQGSGGFR